MAKEEFVIAKDLVSQINDVLDHLLTVCGGKRSRKACSECEEYKRCDSTGFISQCYFIHKAKQLLRKFRKIVKKNKFIESLRNCDVGTADEQAERFHKFCASNSSGVYGMCSPNCPCISSTSKCNCLCKWMQMSYESEVKND